MRYTEARVKKLMEAFNFRPKLNLHTFNNIDYVRYVAHQCVLKLSVFPHSGQITNRCQSKTIAIFRIPGAWEDEGFKILAKYGVDYCDRSVSMYEAAGRAVAKLA